MTSHVSRSLAMAFLAAFVTLSAFADDASARRWTLGEKQRMVEAELLDFNGQQILLGTDGNEQLVVNLSELTVDDLQYVKNRVELQQSIEQQELERQQLQQQRIRTLSRYYDQWQVELIAPNGDRIMRNYFARSNIDAGQQALAQYPIARIGYTKKIRRRSF